MKFNVGKNEQTVRILLGIILIGLGFFSNLTPAWQIAAFVAGGIALVTGAIKFCPLWAIFGINTNKG